MFKAALTSHNNYCHLTGIFPLLLLFYLTGVHSTLYKFDSN